jgi:hypothetical protein
VFETVVADERYVKHKSLAQSFRSPCAVRMYLSN